MKNFFGFLVGKKTYIIAALSAVLTMMHATGQINDAMYQSLLALLGSGAVATVSAKINRIQKQTDSDNFVGYNSR